MSTFRLRGRRLAIPLALAAVVVTGGVGFAVLSPGAHAASASPNACSDAGAAPDCTVLSVAHYKGHDANAQFSQSDGNADCPVTTATYVWAGENVQHDTPTPPAASTEMTVQIYQADCYGNVTLDAWGSSTEVTLDAPSTNLMSASAHAAVPVTDFSSGNTFDVSVDLTWKGIGGITQRDFISHQRSPSMQLNFHESGDTRLAIVSGTVVAGTTDYASGSTALGSLSLVNTGTMSATR